MIVSKTLNNFNIPFLGKTKIYALKQTPMAERVYGKHVPNWWSLVLYMDVAIKCYAISSKTGSTFDGFIDCTLDLSFQVSTMT